MIGRVRQAGREAEPDPAGGRRLRVLHVYKDVFPAVVGGIERQIDILRQGMPDVVSNVIVCARSPRTSVHEVASGSEVRVAEYGPRWLSVPIAPSLPYWVARVEADLIHLHMPNPPGESAALASRRGRPLVVSYHAEIVRQARLERGYRPLVNRCLARANTIIAGSERLAQRSAALGRHAAKVRVIPFAVDVERFDRAAVPAEAVRALRERYGTPLVVAVGRLVYYKGYEHLIEAARELEASIVIVGAGPAEADLRARAGDAANVHFAGRVDDEDLLAHLAAADCFALSSSSRAESFGIAVAEAQAMGLPAVVTDTGTGTIEAIEPGSTGLVVPPRDPRALAEALDSLLADPGRRRTMGEQARRRAVDRHDLRERVADVRNVYEEVIRSAA